MKDLQEKMVHTPESQIIDYFFKCLTWYQQALCAALYNLAIKDNRMYSLEEIMVEYTNLCRQAQKKVMSRDGLHTNLIALYTYGLLRLRQVRRSKSFRHPQMPNLYCLKLELAFFREKILTGWNPGGNT